MDMLAYWHFNIVTTTTVTVTGLTNDQAYFNLE